MSKIRVLAIPSDAHGVGKYRVLDPYRFIGSNYGEEFHVDIVMDVADDDKIFENIDFTVKPLPKGEYESCSFIHCNLSSVDVSHYTFIDTNFVGCNLSLLKLNNTILRDISFKGCKMIGLHTYQFLILQVKA